MFDLDEVQTALREFGFEGWLLHDFRNSNLLAKRILGMEESAMQSRRWFYLVPARGEPKKLVHRIEAAVLDHLPGGKGVYLRWQELEAGIADLLAGVRQVAMEYSPRNAIPYISRIDAGTMELVRAAGVEPVSSGDLIQRFEATWDEEQWQLHRQAERHTTAAFDVAYRWIADGVRRRGSVRESEVIAAIMEHFARNRMTTCSPPIVAVGPHSGDPHYQTTPASDAAMKEGDFVLIDLWAKLDQPRAVYSDLTRMAFVGREVPDRYQQVFRIVAQARDAAIDRVRQAFTARRPLQGWQVDQAARDVIEKAGYGQYFVHRTGHSIGQETHGNGANMDNLETHEVRRVLPRTCFSIEPGIYLPEFGVRSEVNLFVDSDGQVHVTGGEPQQQVMPVLAHY